MNAPSAREVFLEFREQAIWLQTCYNIYRSLFESSEETSQLLRKAAHAFFGDINLVLVEYVQLQIGRLTDPPRGSGNRANLSVLHINELLAAEGRLTPAITSASDDMQRYRDIIVAGRNRIIAHADRDTMLAAAVLGMHTKSDVLKFFGSLYTYIDEVGIAVEEGPLDITNTASPGDVLDLLAVLKRGNSAHEQSNDAEPINPQDAAR